MSSDDETYTENNFDCPEELQIILANEEFNELSSFFGKVSKEDQAKAVNCFQYGLNYLVQTGKYELVLELVSSFGELNDGPWPAQCVLHRYFYLVSVGDVSELEGMIGAFGVYPGIVSKRGLNLFEEAVFSKSLAMVKFVKESLGVDSKEEKILLEASNMGHKGILQYLYEEVGIEPNDTCALIKHSIAAGSLECLHYIRYYMCIGSIKDYTVLEFALGQSMQTHRLDLLSFLITNFLLEFSPQAIPPFKRNSANKKINNLYSTFHKAVQYNDTNFILFALHAVKVKLACKDPESDLICYLDLLNICAKKGHFSMLKVLVDHGKLSPPMLLKTSEDQLRFTIEKSSLRKKDKLRMLRYLKKRDLQTDYDEVIGRVLGVDEVEPESASLKRVKYRESDG